MGAQEVVDRLIRERDQVEKERDRLRELVEQARYCVTAALNCSAHPWHGSDDARRWLMRASALSPESNPEGQ